MRVSSAAMPPIILFASEEAANFLVAGVPAAARALRNAAEAAGRTESSEPISVAVPGNWTPSKLCHDEAQRLAPQVEWSAENAGSFDASTWISGADLQSDTPQWQPHIVSDLSQARPATITDLQQQSRQIIAATGKAGDGIVSRHINRPISQAISRILLKWPQIRPWHATCAAAIIGVVMFLALLLGEGAGLIAGAILFQAASIVDGVDGEIARATFRSSARGAMMDSLTDAATNLGFIGGVSYNLYASGAKQAGLAGAIGFALLAFGSAILAVQARRDGGAFTFDGLKKRFAKRPSRLKQVLTYITMRDFYAFAAFLAILAGGASYLLFAFAIIAAGWFMVLCWNMVRSA